MLLIGLVSQKLKLRAVVTCTALIYWHRYHAAAASEQAATTGEENDIGLACLFLACKVEECGIHIERFLEEANKIVKSQLPMQERREQLITNETHVLKQIGFNLVVEHVHPLAKELILANAPVELQSDLTNHAFAILQDFLAKDAQYIQLDVEMLAKAAVSLAVKYVQFTSKSSLLDLDSIIITTESNKLEILQLEHRIINAISLQ